MSRQSTIPVKKHGSLSMLEPIRDFREEMERFWGRPWMSSSFGRLDKWMPSVDVFEKNGDLVVKADLPGMKKSDVDVFVEDGDLVLQGERKQESEVKEDDYYRTERSYGSFYRRLPLSEGIDASKVKAKFADGVLEVDIPLPKIQKPKAEKIKVA